MSMFSTMSTFVQTTFSAATQSINSLEKGLDIVNHYVAVNHEQLTSNMTNQAQLAETKASRAIAEELEADANLKTQFDSLTTKYDKFR